MIEGKGENQRVSVLQNKGKLVCLQLAELQRNVQQLTHQNKRKYQQVIRMKPDFDYRLYKVNEYQSLGKAIGRELLLRQLDRLMEQEIILERQLSLIRIHNEDTQSHKQFILSAQITPYEALRSAWKQKGVKHDSAAEHLESLNEVVGQIKHSLRKITEIQSSSSEQSNSEYLKYYAIERCAGQTCNNCVALQQSKNQLRIKYQQLQKTSEALANQNQHLTRQISNKEEQIRRLTTKMMEKDTQSQMRLLQLEDRLMSSDQQLRQLRRSREELQSNAFFNQEENYQLIIQTERDLSHYSKYITVELNTILEVLANTPTLPQEASQTDPPQMKMMDPCELLMLNSGEVLIPQLSFGFSNSREKALTKKNSLTDRPRTERVKLNNQRLQKIEELQLSSRRYIRTNQLTTKRNNSKVMPFSFLQGKCSASTVKLSESPKNMEQAN